MGDDARLRVRLLAACVFVLGVAMVQSPGLLVADTKFDLAVAPGEFLARAMHLWDAEGALGQLQNQAYGYLWPTGPFFLLGVGAGIPAWVVQRLWTGLVMSVALTGAARLARAFGVRSDLACLLAGFAYALSPRMLTTLGPISSESWPMALAPWVLLPLVVGAERGSPRRAAALSALAVAMVGGVNAAAASAVLPLGILWLLTRRPGPRRRSMMLWWPLFTALGTLWWLVPLFLMGAYSPPFLDFIESASVTTFPTTVLDALRGTSNWVPYINANWRAGNDLLTAPQVAFNHGVLLVLGLVGLLHGRAPHRLFLACGLVAGLLLVTIGHTGVVQGWLASDVQAVLDGVLSPLRNVHKFDPVVRVPLVLGLAFLVDQLLASARRRAQRSAGADAADLADGGGAAVRRITEALPVATRFAVVGTAMVAVLGAAVPVVAGRLTPANGMAEVPAYWSEVAAWLGSQEVETTALLLPGSSFGTYVWGTPWDEPLQSLAESRWTVRNAVPLTPVGNIRMLDSLQSLMAQGEGSAGLAPALRRAGISHLVVRNDLARSQDVPDPVLVHQALGTSPGIVPVASFGPEVGGDPELVGRDGGRVVVNGGWQDRYPALEVFAVQGGTGPAVGADVLPVVVGGSEDLLDLARLGLLGEEPTVLAPDAERGPDEDTPLILTDGLRRVERSFGRVHDAASATLAPGDPLRLDKPVRDYLLEGADRWLTQARITGARALTASSSMADADALGTVQPGQHPYAAVDGDPATAWRAGYDADDPAWWQLRLEDPRDVETVTVHAGDADEVVRVRVGEESSAPVAVAGGESVTLRVGADSADVVRVEDASGRAGHRMSLAEVSVPGVVVDRFLELPALPEGWRNPDVIALRALDDGRTGCATVGESVRCEAARAVTGEEEGGFSRLVRLPADGTYTASVRVRARPGDALLSTLLRGQLTGISASSTGVADARASALAAVDGDPGTTWVAESDDPRPSLSLNWLGLQRVRTLDFEVERGAAARMPRRVTVEWFGGSVDVDVDDSGRARLPRAITTDGITVRVEETDPTSGLNFDGFGYAVPVGVSELRVAGVPGVGVTLSDEPFTSPCGSGPALFVDGALRPTAVRASAADLVAGEEVTARPCGPGERAQVDLERGENRFGVAASAAFVPTSLVLQDGSVPAVTAVPVAAESAGPVASRLTPEEPVGTVVLRANANPGWVAEAGDVPLQPLLVDGWQQGWRADPADGGLTPVTTHFAPDPAYRLGLAVGGVSGLVLLALLLVPGRRWPGAEAERTGERTIPPGLGVGLALLAAGLLGGFVGVLAGAAGLGTAWWLSRDGRSHGGWLALALVPAVLAPVARPWGSSSGWAGEWAWPSLLAITVVAGVLGLAAARAAVSPAAETGGAGGREGRGP